MLPSEYSILFLCHSTTLENFFLTLSLDQDTRYNLCSNSQIPFLLPTITVKICTVILCNGLWFCFIFTLWYYLQLFLWIRGLLVSLLPMLLLFFTMIKIVVCTTVNPCTQGPIIFTCPAEVYLTIPPRDSRHFFLKS